MQNNQIKSKSLVSWYPLPGARNSRPSEQLGTASVRINEVFGVLKFMQAQVVQHWLRQFCDLVVGDFNPAQSTVAARFEKCSGLIKIVAFARQLFFNNAQNNSLAKATTTIKQDTHRKSIYWHICNVFHLMRFQW